MERFIAFLKKYKEIILYLVVGGLTTLINVAAYWIFAHPVSLNTVISTVLAWFVSVLFAFFANKIIVFGSKSYGKKVFAKEMLLFFASRAATGALDVAIMYVFVDLLLFNDVVMKIISNVIIIILNYVISKFLVFGKKK